MNAAEIAKAAAKLAAWRELLAEQTEADAARNKLQAQIAMTFDLAVAELKEPKWFPGVTWQIEEDRATLLGGTGFGDGTCIVLADASDPSGPVKLMVTRTKRPDAFTQRESSVRLDIRFASPARDRDTGYGYYATTPVHNAADVGKLLK